MLLLDLALRHRALVIAGVLPLREGLVFPFTRELQVLLLESFNLESALSGKAWPGTAESNECMMGAGVKGFTYSLSFGRGFAAT